MVLLVKSRAAQLLSFLTVFVFSSHLLWGHSLNTRFTWDISDGWASQAPVLHEPKIIWLSDDCRGSKALKDIESREVTFKYLQRSSDGSHSLRGGCRGLLVERNCIMSNISREMGPFSPGIPTRATIEEGPPPSSSLGHLLAKQLSMCNLSPLEKQPQIIWTNRVIPLVGICVLIPEKKIKYRNNK